MSTLALVISHLVAVVAGAFAWPEVVKLYAAFKANKVLADAKALVAKAEADAAALVKAKAVVASVPASTPPIVLSAGATGATGPVGAAA